MKNLLSIVLSAFLLGSISLLYVAKKDNDRFVKDFKVTKSKADSLLTATGTLQNDVTKANRRTDSLAIKNDELGKSLSQITITLTSREKEIRKNNKATQEAAKKYDDLFTLQKDGEKQLVNLKIINARLENDNKSLMLKLSSLTEANKQLNDELMAAKVARERQYSCRNYDQEWHVKFKGQKSKKNSCHPIGPKRNEESGFQNL